MSYYEKFNKKAQKILFVCERRLVCFICFTDYLKNILTKNIDVTVITLNTGRCDEIRALGVNVIEIELHCGYSNLLYEFNTLIKIVGSYDHYLQMFWN